MQIESDTSQDMLVVNDLDEDDDELGATAHRPLLLSQQMEDSGHQGPEENKLMMRSSVIVDRVDILSLSEGSDNEQAVARLSQIVTEAASELENSSKSHHEEIMAQKVSNYRRFKRNPANVEVKEENKADEEA